MTRWICDLLGGLGRDARGKRGSPRLEDVESRCPESEESALDAYLRHRSTEAGRTPEGLHDDIMRSVRLAAARRRCPERPSRAVHMRLTFASLAVALTLGFAVYWTSRAPSKSHLGNQVSETTAIPNPNALAEHAAASLPRVIAAPLQEEWSRLRLDARATADALLASVPSGLAP